MTHTPTETPIRRPTLMFGLLGGALAWLVHLLVAYLLAEFGCLTVLRQIGFLGITAVAWSVLAVSVVTLAAAVAAAVVAGSAWKQLRGLPEDAVDPRGADLYFAWAGLLMSSLFAFVIVVETIPIFWFLKDC